MPCSANTLMYVHTMTGSQKTTCIRFTRHSDQKRTRSTSKNN